MSIFDFLKRKNTNVAGTATSADTGSANPSGAIATNTSGTDTANTTAAPKSLYDLISESIVDGELPQNFSLPSDNANGLMFADGAMDGIGIFHMAGAGVDENVKNKMGEALRAAAAGDNKKAEALFTELGKAARARSAIDDFQKYIMEHREELDPTNVYKYAVYAVTRSFDKECVKYGMSILELFNTDTNEELKKVVRTLGLSEEFSQFAMFIMLTWQDGNNELFRMAQKVHGWGRIEAIEKLKPETEEIKRWLLLDGVHNNIIPAYSAYECWSKSGAEDVLKAGPTKEEFEGIRDIIEGLLDEGPCAGISLLDNAEDMLVRFLEQAKELSESAGDYYVISNIKATYEDNENANHGIVTLCNELLSSDKCKALVAESVKRGEYVDMAQEIGLDYREDVFCAIKADVKGLSHLCIYLMNDPEYRDKVLELFRKELSLPDMKTAPGTSLGLGQQYWKQSAVEFVLQGLKAYPLEGIDFVETVLQSEPIRCRNMALNTLESWVKEKSTPLSELHPEIHKLLLTLREIEPDEKVKKRMDELVSGKTEFERGFRIQRK